jgi:choice-of-anchor C domain-containing protein
MLFCSAWLTNTGSDMTQTGFRRGTNHLSRTRWLLAAGMAAALLLGQGLPAHASAGQGAKADQPTPVPSPTPTVNPPSKAARRAAKALTMSLSNPLALGDGGFEAPVIASDVVSFNAVQPLDAWTITTGSIDMTRAPRFTPVDGSQSLDLNGCTTAGRIAQSLTVKPGKSYAVTFSYAGNFEGSPTVKAFHVELNGTQVGSTFSFDTTGRSGSNMGWVRGEVDFVPTGATVEVAFASDTAGCYGAMLDATAVVPIPSGGAVVPRELSTLGNACLPCGISSAAIGSRGDPVDTSSGGFAESFTDLSMFSRSPVVWSRSYSSVMAADDGPLGFGWHASYAAHLVINAGTGNVVVSQENGAEVSFINTAGTLTAPQRAQATLTKNADGTYTFLRQKSQTLKFTATGALTSIADRNGETTTLAYAAGKLSTVTDPAGRALTVTFTGTHITRVADPIGDAVLYGYTGGDLTSVTAADTGVSTFGYDTGHHLSSILDPEQQSAPVKHPLTMMYDTQNRVHTQTDQLGLITTFDYTGDPATGAGETTVTTDPSGHQQQDFYQFGLRTFSVSGLGTAAATTTNYTYDADTLGLTSTAITAPGDPNNHLTTASYDVQGHPLTQVDGAGREIDATYNTFGEPLTVTGPNPSTIGPSQVTTTNTYDATGNLLTVTRPLYTSPTAHTDQITTYQRATPAHPGDVTTLVDPMSFMTVNVYGTTTGLLTSVTSSQGRKTTYTYDTIGRTRTKVAPNGNVSGGTPANFTTTYGYDAASRLTSTTVANGATPIITSSTYDKDGRLTRMTDPLNQATVYSYDLASQQTSVQRPDLTTVRTDYFPDGALKTQTDAANHATNYTEDALGRASTVTDALARVTGYTFDGSDAVLTKTAPGSLTTTNAYDNSGALISTTYSDGVTPTVTTTHNAAGLVATMLDGTGTTTDTYDSLGRLTQQVTASGTVKYGYSLRNQVNKITYPNGNVVTRAYGGDGLWASVTDWLTKQTTFGYDKNGALTTITYPNTVVTTNTYDNPGRITAQSFVAGATSLGTLTYTPDLAGQLKQQNTTGLGPNQTYTYNTIGQVKTAGATTFNYDAGDNLTTTGAVTQNYDAANQLTTTVNAGTTLTYGYDTRGNRTTRGSTTYSYDQANRLTKVQTGPTVNGTYTYDGNGLRQAKTVGTITTRFAYDTVEALPLILNDGTNNYISGPAGTPIEQLTASGVATYLHADQVGSPRLLTSSTGASIGTANYDAYGARTTTGVTTPCGFAGQYTDTESALIWLRARYYDPDTGQFLSRDPIESMTRQPYSYANGNPLDFTDPAGLFGWHSFLSTVRTVTFVGQSSLDLVGTVAAFVPGGQVFAAAAFTAGTALGAINAAATCTDAAIGGAGAVSRLDCAASLATIAGTVGWAKLVSPTVSGGARALSVEEGFYRNGGWVGVGNLFGDAFGAAWGYKIGTGTPTGGLCDAVTQSGST